MTKSDIFQAPGRLIGDFSLELLDISPNMLDPIAYKMMVIFISLFVWMKFLGGCLVIIKRTFGFYGRG